MSQHAFKIHTIDTAPSFHELLSVLDASSAFAIDLETTGLDSITAEIVGISAACGESEGYYIPVGHTEGRNLDRDFVLGGLSPLLTNPKWQKIGHNLKYDGSVLMRHHIELRNIWDTLLAGYLLKKGVFEAGLDLGSLAKQELNYTMQPIEELIGPRGKDQKSFAEVPISDAAFYSGEDSVIAWRLALRLKQAIEKQHLATVLETMELPLIPVLIDMELAGMKIDTKILSRLSKEFEKQIMEIAKKIYDTAGTSFNLNSPKQLAEILFTKLGVPVKGIKKTKTGYSTASSELEKIKLPIAQTVIEYRELTKLKNTYIDVLPAMVHPATKRIHTSFNQAIAATGRLSSSNPNLQNIPIRTEAGRKIRKAFIAERGNVLISADYSQIELRILAHMSGDEELISAFRNNEDIHTKTAAIVEKVPPERVTTDMRRAAKVVNFGVLYGLGPQRLARETNLSFEEAKQFIENYFAGYPMVRKWMDETLKHAYAHGFAETMFGRRRYIPELASDEAYLRSAGERMAINMPIQGTAADIMKLAMITVHSELALQQRTSRIVLQVHDELVIESPAAETENIVALLRKSMPNVAKLKVPLNVDISVGKNWNDAEPVSG